MVFYFSGTGNSKAVASMLDDTLIEINDRAPTRYNVENEAVIGFVFPTYYYHIPTIVENFIKQLKLDRYQNQYIFLVLTCGGSTANADLYFKRIFRYPISSIFSVVCVDNYIMLSKLPDEEKVEEIQEASKKETLKIKEKIDKGALGNLNAHRGSFPKVLSKAGRRMYIKGRKTKKFHITECTECMQCINQCPIHAIDMVDGKITWVKPKCTLCLKCLHQCPVDGIQYGRHTKNKTRYKQKNS